MPIGSRVLATEVRIKVNDLDSQADLDHFPFRGKPSPRVQWGAIEEKRFGMIRTAEHARRTCHASPERHK